MIHRKSTKPSFPQYDNAFKTIRYIVAVFVNSPNSYTVAESLLWKELHKFRFNFGNITGASGSACRLWTERSQVRAVASTHCTVCGKDLPLITSSRPRTVREPTALGTSFLTRYIDFLHIQHHTLHKTWYDHQNLAWLNCYELIPQPVLKSLDIFVTILNCNYKLEVNSKIAT